MANNEENDRRGNAASSRFGPAGVTATKKAPAKKATAPPAAARFGPAGIAAAQKAARAVASSQTTVGAPGALSTGRQAPVAPTGSPTTGPVKRGPSAADIAAKAAANAAAKAAADAAAAKRKAGESSLARAANLEPQIRALQLALGDEGFKKALDQNLADLLSAHEAGIKLLKEGYAERAKGFLGTADDTEQATAGQQSDAFENLVRERQDTMTNLLSHGAGETDALKAMVMAARQFRDNTAEGNRAYYDTMRTVQTGLSDLNLDTKTAMQNSALNLESERDRLWQNYYDRRSDTFTQLGNLYGQQGDYYISAEENDVSSGGKKETAAKSAEEAWMNSARETGKSYVSQGVPAEIQNWTGIEAPKARQSNTDLAAAVKFEPIQQAEGAGLRTW